MTLSPPGEYRPSSLFPHLRERPRLHLVSLLALVVLLALGPFLARAPLELCVGVVLGAVGAVMLLLRPAVAIYALAFSVPFGSLFEVSIGGVTFGPSELLFFGFILAWLLRATALREVPSLRSSLTMPHARPV